MSRTVLDSTTLRVLLWAIENPADELTVADIGAKFGLVSYTDIYKRMDSLVQAGLLGCRGFGRLNPRCFFAGPELQRKVLAGAAQILDER